MTFEDTVSHVAANHRTIRATCEASDGTPRDSVERDASSDDTVRTYGVVVEEGARANAGDIDDATVAAGDGSEAEESFSELTFASWTILRLVLRESIYIQLYVRESFFFAKISVTLSIVFLCSKNFTTYLNVSLSIL